MDDATYFEEDVVVETYEVDSEGGSSLLTKIGQWGAVLFAFLFPIITLPYTISVVEMNKAYFAAVAASILLITWLGGSLQEGRVRLPRSWVFYAYGAVLAASLVASFFSQSIFTSLIGAGGEPGTFLTLLVGGILLFVLPALLNDARWVYRACLALFSAQVVIALFFIVRTGFNIKILPWAIDRGFNLVGDWSTTGAFFAVMAACLLPLFSLPKSKMRMVSGIIFFVTVVLIALTNFTFGIIALGLVTLILLALLLSRQQGRSAVFSVSLLLLLALTLMVLMRNPLGEIATKIGAPLEASPNWTATISLSEKAFKESALFGYGPNTFALLWDKYRPVEINTTPVWSLRFTAGAALVPTLIAEGGLVMAIALLFFFFVFISVIFRGLSVVTSDNPLFVMVQSLGSASIVLGLLWWLHPINSTLVLLTFVTLGLFVAALHASGASNPRLVSLFSSTERGFIASLIIILLLIGGVAGIYQEIMRYVAQVAFAEGVNQFNTNKGLNTARNSLVQATQYDSRQDQFWRALAQIEIVRIQRIVTNQDQPTKDTQDLFRTALASAIDYGKRATDLGPQDSSNWNTVGQIYEAVIFTPGSYEVAIQNYEKAHALAPTNPAILLNEARTHLDYANVLILQQKGNKAAEPLILEAQNKAIDALNQATSLKPDFTEAHFLLAQIYQRQGKIDDAIARAQSAYQVRPNDLGIIFQLGVLYYQKGDLDRARVAFEAAIASNPNYSNALYFLGLIADQKGDKPGALTLFHKVLDLNPDNQDVKNIIANLEAGKSALDKPSDSTPPGDVKDSTPAKNPPKPKTQ